MEFFVEIDWMYWLSGTLAALVLTAMLFLYNRYQKKVETVKKHSVYYGRILQLNEKTRYHANIPKGKALVFHSSSTTLRDFNRMNSEKTLMHLLEGACGGEILTYLCQTEENRKAYNDYCRFWNAYASQITRAECESLSISYEDFLRIETQLVERAKLTMVQSICVTCIVSYTSPQGRNHYQRKFVFSEDEIRAGFLQIKERARLRQTEAYRRKQERSKVTASVRYRVMMRDGNRCRLCGRSPMDGTTLEVDHIIPISRGGTSDEGNLQTLCRECNRGKGAAI